MVGSPPHQECPHSRVRRPSAIPLISFLLVLPISLSGLGVREGGYVYLFAQAGVSAPLALAMSLLFYALNVATGLIGGVLYVFEGARGYLKKEKE